MASETFEVIEEGFVARRDPDQPRLVAAGARACVLRDGSLLCAYSVQTAIGSNDFAVTPSRSTDDGRTWTDPQVIPRDLPSAVEAPGPLCVTRDGRWIACYAPYPTFEPMPNLDRQQIVAVDSADQGATWSCQSALRFDETSSTGAEAWVVELSDGRLVAACWHMSSNTEDESAGVDYPNKFTVSEDGGCAWGPATTTGTMGQSIGLAPLPDGRLLMAYNQRQQEPAGVRLAFASPAAADFRLQADELVWEADQATRSDSAGGHSGWTDFAFGEPAPLPLPDGAVPVLFWCMQPEGQGVGYVRVAMQA